MEQNRKYVIDAHSMRHKSQIKAHYEEVWGARSRELSLGGPVKDLPEGFAVLEFRPSGKHDMWAYATCCMSDPSDAQGLELHIFSPIQSSEPTEILFAVAHFHRTAARLGLGHTVNFGKPWLNDSKCEFGLVSRPYLDGPDLENFVSEVGARIQFLWLIPITKQELECKKKRGLDYLEERFEAAGFNYLDPNRSSVC